VPSEDKSLVATVIVVVIITSIFSSATLLQQAYGQGTTTNVGLDISSGIFTIDGNLIAFGVSEFNQGSTDLNGDGDANDGVLHVFNARTGTTTNVGLDLCCGIGIDGNLIAFGVSEFNQGNTDFNGDGDANDGVLHVFVSR